MRINRITRVISLSVTCSLLSSCASVQQFGARHGTTAGCVAGGIAGGLIGAAVSSKSDRTKGALIGATIGGVAGCAAGNVWQTRLQELQKVAKEENLNITFEELSTSASNRQPKDSMIGLVAQIQDESMFPLNSDQLTSEGLRKVRRIAKVYASSGSRGKTAEKSILIIGHTDSTGRADYNQKLSERRAKTVAKLLEQEGISANRLHFQGAGASRPIADNTDPIKRALNRRVEIVEVDSRDLLVQRVRNERNNPKYLAHNTKTSAPTPSKPAGNPSKPKAKPSSDSRHGSVANTDSTVKQNSESVQPSKSTKQSVHRKGEVNFGGQPVTTTHSLLAQSIEPKKSGFNLMSVAHASAPTQSCLTDMPRIAGEAKNLATDHVLTHYYSTTDYLPGMNNQVWGQAINGHSALLGPVSILKEDALVAKQPKLDFITHFKTAQKKRVGPFEAFANTYEGETKVLYRVFAKDTSKSPVTCMDIVFDKRSGTVINGELFYLNNGEAFVAQYMPKMTSMSKK